MTIRDKAAIAGIGHTRFAKRLDMSEYEMAAEAVWNACDDAGISPRDIDGIVRYDMEQTDEEQLLAMLGNPLVRFFAGTPFGGGGSASVLVVAATAIAAGMADTVLVFRSRARGKRSSYGEGRHQGGRYWEKLPQRLSGLNQWHVPQGLVSAFQEMAMISMRHRIEYGTTDDQYAAVAVAFRQHAMRNPSAVMRVPMTRADHHASRLISDPLRLYDCNIETDGAVAMIVTSTERARDLRRPPAIIRAGAMAAGSHHIRLSTLFERGFDDDSPRRAARQLFAMADCEPQDIDVAFFYDFFTSLVIIALEQYGFAPRGEGGPFAEHGGLAWPDGRLVCNTNGGQLSEAFIHGFNNTIEAVRQIRGTSTSQVDGCELAFVAGGNTDPTGAVILRRDWRSAGSAAASEVAGESTEPLRIPPDPPLKKGEMTTRPSSPQAPRPPLPDPTGDDAPFYEAARRGELRFQKCTQCGVFRHYPRPACARCLSREYSWEKSSGRGIVYTWTIVRGPTLPAFEPRLPYNVVDVLMDEGVHFVSQVIDCVPAEIYAGMPVEAVFVPQNDEITLPKFRRVGRDRESVPTPRAAKPPSPGTA
jgi:acetyl-CoA acetyltransferase/uncharacterized OB-fold protein